MSYRIPFNKPGLAGDELRYIADAITRGHSAGDGSYTAKCHAYLQDKLNAPRVLLTTSCTHALEMAALLLDIQPGDEVIVPAFTFVSTVNAFVLRGARPVFCDIRPDTLNLDEKQVEQAITPRTRAIVPVHYAGVGCEMDAILEIARRHGVAVVEDNAHGLFARYKGRYLGTFGCLATQSFHVRVPSVPWMVKLNVPAAALPNVTVNGAPAAVGVIGAGVEHVAGAPAVQVTVTLLA